MSCEDKECQLWRHGVKREEVCLAVGDLVVWEKFSKDKLELNFKFRTDK